ncbi:MAG: 5'/3'-nucleotidase SurE [Candidatus Aminicenantes bacterium]|nr:5'/3'-nucleotidase SurE [Candidatus Aminicenantes bacterium]MBL7084041.1 5'/3'-nucleotidase SurE [Candidatus Aminicenantes bacterium]
MNHLILLTNDDGFFSEGIESLFRYLKDLGQIYIVAPDREKSATSLAITLRRPLRVKKIKANVYAVDGTPADCVYLARQKLLPKKPSLLISGLNRGPNLGQQDISYSGTVAAAIQGTFLKISSIAVSLLPDENHEYFYDFSAKIVHLIARKLLEDKLPENVTLNINIPPPPFRGIKIVKLGQKRYNPKIIEKTDPRKKPYYWIGTGNPKAKGDKDSDVFVVKEGYMTITPLHTDMTDYQAIQHPIFKNILKSMTDEAS